MKLAALVILVLAVSACADGDLDSGLRTAAEGTWKLDSATDGGVALDQLADKDITLRIEGGELSGRAACNSYFGSYTPRPGGSIVIGEGIGSTEMWCDGLMDAERIYLDALGKINRAALVDGGLVLSGDNYQLTFTRQEVPAPRSSDNPNEPIDSGSDD